VTLLKQIVGIQHVLVFIQGALALAEAITAWILTTRRPPPRGRLLALSGWCLRALATASALLWLGAMLFPDQYAAARVLSNPVLWIAYLTGICGQPLGLLYLGALFDDLGLPRHVRTSRVLAVALLVSLAVWSFVGRRTEIAALVMLTTWACQAWGILLVFRLRKALSIQRHDFWVDATNVTSPGWASLVVGRDGRALVLTPEGERRQFESVASAERHLEARAFIEGSQALADKLVRELPPSPLRARA
jgi:hypothetical protein